MSDEPEAVAADDFTWRLTLVQGKATIEFGSWKTPKGVSEAFATNLRLKTMGEALIKIGTQCLQSSIEDGEPDWDDD